MKHLVLVGDSIFDNASYVSEGESVSEQLTHIVDSDTKVTLLAVDGAVTTDIPEQLSSFPTDATHVFVSCGGNDGLRIINILQEPATTVGDALEILTKAIETFRKNYCTMLKLLLNKHSNLAVCTIYNSIPGISENALTALALFNEVILEETISNNLPIIDLRKICKEYEDYSQISPIEPSGKGAEKIAKVIKFLAYNHRYGSTNTNIYT